MKIRKHMTLIVGGGISLVLFLAALVVLWKFYSSYSKVQEDLQSRTQRLDVLHRRNPYPSDENVRIEQSNLKEQKDRFFSLLDRLSKKQFEADKIEPAEFPILLEKKIRSLSQGAQRANVKLPDSFFFGFDTYARGRLPVKDDIPRLVLQMKTTEALCHLLYGSRVSEIVSLHRQVFEHGVDAAGGGGAEPAVVRGRRREAAPAVTAGAPGSMPAEAFQDPDGLFSVEQYRITFRTRDSGVWETFNALVKCHNFITVSRVELLGDTPSKQRADLGGRVAAAGAARVVESAARAGLGGAVGEVATTNQISTLSRSERLMAGSEQVQVTLDLKVFHFMNSKADEVKK